MAPRHRSSLGGLYLPDGWEKVKSGMYAHPKFGLVYTNKVGSSSRRWTAEPRNQPPTATPHLTLRSAMLECELIIRR